VGDLRGHPFRGNQWTPVVGVHPMSHARLRELKKRSRGDGPASVQARRQLANMRLPNETGEQFVQRQLVDEEFLDAQAAKRSAKEVLIAQLSESRLNEERTASIRRAANIEALLVNPGGGGVPKPVYGKDGQVVNLNEIERARR